jgi:hypothetical protein
VRKPAVGGERLHQIGFISRPLVAGVNLSFRRIGEAMRSRTN